MFGSGDDVGGCFYLCGIRIDHTLREHCGGRLVRLIVVLERLLLDVHRRAQHDRAGLELGAVERLAHTVVRQLRGRDADEAVSQLAANAAWSIRWRYSSSFEG